VASFDGILLGALHRPARERQAYVQQSIGVLITGLG
jgi:hypothetical protein